MEGAEFPTFDLDGQVALVTGASRGIGHDLALALAHAGASVAVTARAIDDLREISERIAGEGREAHPLALDVRDVHGIERAVAATAEHFGKLDVLVNNAGVGTNHDAIAATEDEWDEVLDVNLKGLFFCCQAAARQMRAQRYGRIVNMSSQAGHVGIHRHAAYCASKAGVENLTRVLALEWAPWGITVNAVAPTFIRTPGTAERLDRPEFLADVLSRIPLGRVGTTMEVAAAVLFLASPASSLVTGAVLPVDGGWTAQ
jgi:NAD(P)-dependent dehydrogenase (short-subunit alcohol dehydrogenase family)